MRASRKKSIRFYETALIVLACIIVILSVFYATYQNGARARYLKLAAYYGAEFDVDGNLVAAVMRAESDFRPKAVSKAQAKGLMQITDGTAQFIAESLSVTDYDIFDANTNIRFGAFYLSYLSEKFQDLTVLLCAYNAGEGNVYYWLSRSDLSDDGVTLKAIPFAETRAYVDRVTQFYSEYKSK